MINDDLLEKRIELRQKLKSKLLTLSPSYHVLNSFNNFIPNARDMDFLEKQGLDCVMNYLVPHDSIELHETIPNTCSNCEIDSTENWWYLATNNSKKANYLCDQCEQNRMRHVILEQHRQSMKSAFLKAKEIEHRLETDYQKQRQGKSQ